MEKGLVLCSQDATMKPKPSESQWWCLFPQSCGLVYARLGRYEVTTRRDLSIAKVLSATVSASSISLQGRAAVTPGPSPEDETQMEKKPVGKEAHPTAYAAAA